MNGIIKFLDVLFHLFNSVSRVGFSFHPPHQQYQCNVVITIEEKERYIERKVTRGLRVFHIALNERSTNFNCASQSIL
jgi:hypothetical protein